MKKPEQSGDYNDTGKNNGTQSCQWANLKNSCNRLLNFHELFRNKICFIIHKCLCPDIIQPFLLEL